MRRRRVLGARLHRLIISTMIGHSPRHRPSRRGRHIPPPNTSNDKRCPRPLSRRRSPPTRRGLWSRPILICLLPPIEYTYPCWDRQRSHPGASIPRSDSRRRQVPALRSSQRRRTRSIRGRSLHTPPAPKERKRSILRLAGRHRPAGRRRSHQRPRPAGRGRSPPRQYLPQNPMRTNRCPASSCPVVLPPNPALKARPSSPSTSGHCLEPARSPAFAICTSRTHRPRPRRCRPR
jgi:hypothetical protein